MAFAIFERSEKVVPAALVSTCIISVMPEDFTGVRYTLFTSFVFGFRHGSVRSGGTVGALDRRKSDSARANGMKWMEGVLRSNTAAAPAGANSCGDTEPPRCSDLK